MATETKNARDVQPLVETWQAEVNQAVAAPAGPFLSARAVLVLAGDWTEDEAKAAAGHLVIPEGFTVEREPDGTPEVWGRDLFEGHYWMIYLRHAA